MSTILIKDTLRASIEAASGGAQTVLYTAKGQPTFMNIIPKFNTSDVLTGATGVHPAFIVNGVEKSEIYIGTYEGVIRNGELLSLPNVTPTNATYTDYFAAAIANGAGHHMMTNAEWAAVALRSYKDGTLPEGNRWYGASTIQPTSDTGRRVDGLNPLGAITTGDPRILSGSGAVSFRHNKKYNGISDLVGNGKDMLQGARLVSGELQIIANNDSATVVNAASESGLWKAIDARTGDLITPNGSGTTPYAVRFTANQSSAADYTIIFADGGNMALAKQASTTNPVSTTAINLLRKLALYPPADGISTSIGWSYISSSSNPTIISRGGSYQEQFGSGLFAMRLSDDRATSALGLASRPAYYKP